MATVTIGAYTVAISGGGSGYSTATGVSTSGGTGTGLKVNIAAVSGAIVAVAVSPTNPGEGYADGDLVAVSGGTGGVIAVGVTSDYVTINGAILGTTFPGNVLELQADFVHDNTRVTFNKSDVAITSYSGNPRDPGCTVTSDNTYTFLEQGSAGNSQFSGITIENTSASGHAFNMLNVKVTVSDCVIRAANRALSYPGTDTTIQRCHIESSVPDGSIAIGATSTAPDNWAVDSCFFSNWRAAIYSYSSRPTVRNCTFYSPNNGNDYDLVNWKYQGSSSRPEEAKMYNCIIYSSTGTDTMYSGVYVDNWASTANVLENIVAFGDYDVSSFRYTPAAPPLNVTTSDLFDSVPGTNAPTLPIFVAIGTDFHPDPAGSAYQTGNPAHTPAYDIEGNPFDPTTPSLGCYAAASTGGGTTKAVGNSRAGFLSSPFTLTP